MSQFSVSLIFVPTASQVIGGGGRGGPELPGVFLHTAINLSRPYHFYVLILIVITDHCALDVTSGFFCVKGVHVHALPLPTNWLIQNSDDSLAETKHSFMSPACLHKFNAWVSSSVDQ